MSDQDLSSKGIGASEIAAVCGVSPWAGPWNVYAAKVHGHRIEETGPIEWGHRLEPAIRQAYADRVQEPIEIPARSLFHPQIEWARATPDGIVSPGDKGRRRLLQIKNVGYWVGCDSWDIGPPFYVQIQEQWEMFVTGEQRADVAALIGGSDFQVFTIHRDDETIANLVAIAEKFWRDVQERREPPVDHTEMCRSLLGKRMRRDGEVDVADGAIVTLAESWRETSLEIKRAETRIETIKNLLRKEMAIVGAARVSTPIGTISAREAGAAKRTDWKLLAELVASAHLSKDEWRALVDEHTTECTDRTVALYPPKQWSKDV